MRVIFLNRFFAPDLSATSQLLSDLAFALAKEGHEVHVITSRQRYGDAGARLPSREKILGVGISRVWTTSFGRSNLALRALDYLTFYLTAFWRLLLLARRGDVIVAKTDPPLIAVAAGPVAMLRGAWLVNWFQDVFPEIAAATDVAGRMAPVLFRLTRPLRNWTIRKAALNVALGERMSERLQKEGAQVGRVAVIPNWANGDLVRPVDPLDNPLRKAWGLDGKFVAGYSGNLGRVHELDAIIEAMADLADTGLNVDRPITFLFIGGGALYPKLHREIARRGWTNVQFQPHQPAEQLGHSLSVPDVHLISLRPEFEGLVVPSKLYGILAAGRPALFIGDKDGEVARLLRQADCGITVYPSEGKVLAKHIASLAVDPLRVAAMGQRARSAFETQFDKSISLAEWMRCLSAVHASQSPHGAGVMQVSPQRP